MGRLAGSPKRVGLVLMDGSAGAPSGVDVGVMLSLSNHDVSAPRLVLFSRYDLLSLKNQSQNPSTN